MKPNLTHATWRTSSRSTNGNSCVEVADLGTTVAVRDTKDRTGPMLAFQPGDWTAFLAGAREGKLDRM